VRILAIDPGAKSSFAFGTTRDRVECSGVWPLGADPDARPGRLAEYIHLAAEKHQHEVIAYEVAGMGGKNWHAAQRLNELCGAIKAAATQLGCQCYVWHIVSWKARAVGHGKADKAAIIRGLRTYFGIEVSSDDEADAIGIYLASAIGPPPEPVKKQTKAIERKLKATQPMLPGIRGRR
jgi:Holliday junction resolvasome RuvABC endonuclease subunit